MQEEASKRGARAKIKATTIHRLLNYRSWSQRRQGQDKDSSEVISPLASEFDGFLS